MDQEDLLNRYSPEMTSENTGEDFLGTPPKIFPKNPQASIDFHGYYERELSSAIDSFIDMSLSQSLLFVRIITGKGSSTERGYSILFLETERCLKRLFQTKNILMYKKCDGFFDVYLQYVY